jgi:hypothetical protein
MSTVWCWVERKRLKIDHKKPEKFPAPNLHWQHRFVGTRITIQQILVMRQQDVSLDGKTTCTWFVDDPFRRWQCWPMARNYVITTCWVWIFGSDFLFWQGSLSLYHDKRLYNHMKNGLLSMISTKRLDFEGRLGIENGTFTRLAWNSESHNIQLSLIPKGFAYTISMKNIHLTDVTALVRRPEFSPNNRRKPVLCNTETGNDMNGENFHKISYRSVFGAFAVEKPVTLPSAQSVVWQILVEKVKLAPRIGGKALFRHCYLTVYGPLVSSL